MKMAACWYGDFWTITTKKLGETVEYTVTVDVEKVASGDSDLEIVEDRRHRCCFALHAV